MLLRHVSRRSGFGVSTQSRVADDEMPGTDARKISLDLVNLPYYTNPI
jgi:hypothetical protein